MFHDIPEKIKERMEYLEALDRKQREGSMDHVKRLRQIPPQTGQFLTILASSAPVGTYLEIGTSGGYSALWIALACLKLQRKLVTFEVLEEKVRLARQTFESAGVGGIIELIHGDARNYLDSYKEISFCFLDAEKEVYGECYDIIVPNIVSGGLLIADNVISHKEKLATMVDKALHDCRVDALIVPIGSGELVCRKV